MIPLCVVESPPHWVHSRRLGRDGWIGQVGDVDPQHHAPRRMWGTVTSRVSPPRQSRHQKKRAERSLTSVESLSLKTGHKSRTC